MKQQAFSSALAALALAFGLHGGAQAGAISTWQVDSVVNGVIPSLGGTALNTGALLTTVQVQVGDVVRISTASTDRWNINGYQVTAAGFPDGYFGYTSGSHNHGDFSGLNELNPIDYGALAYSLNGTDWARAYNDSNLQTWVEFNATTAGTLRLAMWDTMVNDNGSSTIGQESNILTVTVDHTPGSNTGNSVPEPSVMALLGLAFGMLAIGRRRARA